MVSETIKRLKEVYDNHGTKDLKRYIDFSLSYPEYDELLNELRFGDRKSEVPSLDTIVDKLKDVWEDFKVHDIEVVYDVVSKDKPKGNKDDKGAGLRFNTGKLRYDLLHPIAQEGIVSVLTAGANKYAPRNWEKGMNWSTVLASMKRHIAAIERGEDFDPETKLLHIDHVQCNAHFLSAYYKIFPQGDDRQHDYLTLPKIGLDIDEVLADFVGGLMKRYPDMVDRAVYWNDYKLQNKFSEVIDDESFWLELDAITVDLPFEPHCYITSRPISTEITEKWLSAKGFPKAPVYTVGLDKSKVEIAKESGIDIFVDDAYHNFVELNRAGILCYLYSAPHNLRYDVGFKRIDNLSDLM